MGRVKSGGKGEELGWAKGKGWENGEGLGWKEVIK
jgi:hypothetical protein